MDDRRDRELVRQLRRELDEHKRRSGDLLTEASELRRERDALKLSQNEAMVAHAREVESEKNDRRSIQSELDKALFKLKVAEDEQHKLHLKTEKKSQEVHSIHTEKTGLMGILKEKDILLDSHQRQVNQLKEELRLKS